KIEKAASMACEIAGGLNIRWQCIDFPRGERTGRASRQRSGGTGKRQGKRPAPYLFAAQNPRPKLLGRSLMPTGQLLNFLGLLPLEFPKFFGLLQGVNNAS